MLTVGELSPGAVHVWLGLRPALAPGEFAAWMPRLAPDEQERARSFVFERDAEAFVMARSLLRTLLAAYLHSSPESMRFGYGPQGRPVLAMDRALDFNLSHSGRCVALTVASRGPVGIDVELARPLERLEAFAQEILSPDELRIWGATPPLDRLPLFFEIWTAKEAYLKARGIGLAGDPRELPILTRARHDEGAPGTAKFSDLEVVRLAAPDGYVAALAHPIGSLVVGQRDPRPFWDAVMIAQRPGDGPDSGAPAERRVD